MKPNPNWIVWIYSSFVVYFKTQCASIGLPIFIQGEIRDPSISEFIDFRMDGPHFNEQNNGYWYIDCHIATLLTMTLDENNIYKTHQISGQLLNMFETDLPIYRLGTTGPESNKTLLGCMRLVSNKDERLIQTIYGQIQPATPITQSSIEAHYHMELSFTEEKLTN